jgi:hypothetical protein
MDPIPEGFKGTNVFVTLGFKSIVSITTACTTFITHIVSNVVENVFFAASQGKKAERYGGDSRLLGRCLFTISGCASNIQGCLSGRVELEIKECGVFCQCGYGLPRRTEVQDLVARPLDLTTRDEV